MTSHNNMQKQFSPSSHDQNSISSKSARKLYHRIQNHNIRHLNKSKISNSSQKSIGSVALRRTQFSNDKIYSREEDLLYVNSSQAGISFETAFDQHSDQPSIPMTPTMSNQNSRPRPSQEPSQRSLRSDSRKETKYRPNPRKYNKNQIEKLLMLEGNTNFNNGTQNKERQNKRQSRSHSKKPKQSILSPRLQQKLSRNSNESRIRPIRTIKSSDKSTIKMTPHRTKDQPKYVPSPQQSHQLQNLTKKYKYMINPQPVKSSREIGTFNERIEQIYIGQPKFKNVKFQPQVQRDSQRNLQKYKSEKYLLKTERQNQNRSSRTKYYETDQKLRVQQKSPINLRHQEKRGQPENHQTEIQKYKKEKLYQNSLEKYQKDTWARNLHRKYLKENNPDSKIYEKQMRTKDHYYPLNDYPSPYDLPKKNHEKQKVSREYEREKVHRNYRQNYKVHERKTRSERSLLSSIRIKKNEYQNLYGQNEPENYRSPKKSHDRSPSYKSPSHKQKPYPDHEYYHHIQSPNKKSNPNANSPETKMSSTFDSLILSINSHITSGIGQSPNTKSIIDKINLHLGTLDLIADYALEFKKMYEQIDDWEELIFLAYKKYWVERTKVLEYLKKLKKSKRHESQRKIHYDSKKLIENKVSSTQNMNSENLRILKTDDPFADQNLVTNPFFIPFCKVNQDEAKKVAESQEGNILMQKLQKQTYSAYQKLQQMYNLIISKSGDRVNMLYCDNFSDDMFIMMLDEIQQLIPNLEEFKLFEATKIRLGKIVKSGILILFLNGKVIRNIAEIITFDDCQKIGTKRKIKTFTTYDLYYQVFQRLVAE